ncbi:MAG: hypothetical protein ABIK83_12545 [Candidatus Zixiibacteriota bacterium]
MQTKIACFLGILLITGAAPAFGDNGTVDPGLEIQLFLKVITYDQNFLPESLGAVRLYIVYDRSVPESYEQLLRVDNFLRESPGMSVSGVAVKHESLPIKQFNSAVSRMSSREYNILLVTAVDRREIESLALEAQAAGMRSFSILPEYVNLGLAVGVRVGKKRNSIIVNLESSRREGSNFSAHLLKMCEVIKN